VRYFLLLFMPMTLAGSCWPLVCVLHCVEQHFYIWFLYQRRPVLNKKFFLAVFFIAAIGEIASNGLATSNCHLFKPFIMLGLIGHYWVMATNRSNLFIMALAFCWIGDVLLIFDKINELFFIGGLLGFLVGHIIYIFCYRMLRSSPSSKELLGSQKVRFSFPIILYGTGLVAILYPSLAELKIPVMIYALAITLMAITALLRYGRTNTKSFVFVFVGALLFVFSDSVLALNKFKQPIANAGLLIMVSYCAAQFFIVQGALVHENSKA
jgi:uncharacterized membrane protein YhhN